MLSDNETVSLDSDRTRSYESRLFAPMFLVSSFQPTHVPPLVLRLVNYHLIPRIASLHDRIYAPKDLRLGPHIVVLVLAVDAPGQFPRRDHVDPCAAEIRGEKDSLVRILDVGGFLQGGGGVFSASGRDHRSPGRRTISHALPATCLASHGADRRADT